MRAPPFLANVIFYSSIAGFVIQMTLTSRLHRLLGIGFAMLLMPITTARTAALMLVIPALWTSTLARVLDTSLRYTVDKTTREILFVPLPTSLKYKAKPFADVAVDRFAKGVGAAVALIIAIKIFHFTWWQLSYLSIGVTILWIWMARARPRRVPADLPPEPGDARHRGERSAPERGRPLDYRNAGAGAVPPGSEARRLRDRRPRVDRQAESRDAAPPLSRVAVVRGRALAALGAVRSDIAQQWIPHIRRMLGDGDAGVRAAAIGALSSISQEDAASFARPLLADPDPRIRATAAVAMAGSSRPEDVDLAESALLELAGDTRDSAKAARRDVAIAIRQIADPRFRRLLIPLLYDPAPDVADEAMESVHAARVQSVDDFMFVPTLVSLLRNRRLKGRARAALVGYGEPVVDSLAFFLRDPDEDIWVRRHIPGTLAQIPSQKTMDVLAAALDERDGFIRYKVVSALERLRREHSELTLAGESIEKLAMQEARRYFNFLSLHDNLFGKEKLPADSLLAQGLVEQMTRLRNRIFKLLTLLYPPADIDAARWTLEHGDPRGRSSASEYLDNILSSPLRKQVLPVLEDMPRDERVRRGNALLKTRPRDVEETLLQLINDDDPVTAAVAIDVVREQKMWSLADDVEHVLAHRDVKDWYVFEAASWTLAERRMPAERRRELWLEPLPAAELAGRLRRLPLFASVTVDELFRMASASRQVRHEPGTVLAQEGSVPSSIHILLDGRVTATGRDAAPSTLDAPAALGFVEAMAGLAMPETNEDQRVGGDARADRRGAADAPRRQHRSRQRSLRNAGGAIGRTGQPGAPHQSRERARAARDRRAHGDRPRLRAAVRAALPARLRGRNAACRDGRRARDDDRGVGALPGSRAARALAAPHRRGRARELDRPAARSPRAGATSSARSAPWPAEASAVRRRSSGTASPSRSTARTLFDVLAERPDLLRQMFASMFKRDRPLTATR